MFGRKLIGAVVLSAAAAAAGCAPKEDGSAAADAGAKAAGAKPAHDHSGWWCDEHGIPEEECSMCSAKVAKELKAKGDWCDLHDRAKSQCFLCDPSLKDKFAARYKAKEGKEPPDPVGQKDGAR